MYLEPANAGNPKVQSLVLKFEDIRDGAASVRGKVKHIAVLFC